MSKFKIGDRVWHKDKGEIGEIVGDTERGWWSVKFFLGGTFSVHESRLLLAGPIEHGFITDATGAAVYPITQTKPDKVTLSDFNAENKYARKLYPLAGEPVMVDVYRVIDAFGVTDPAIQHAIKKLLMPGKRGAKGAVQDLEEAAFSIRQSVELMKQKGG